MASIALAVSGAISAAGALSSGINGANAAKTAAGQETTAANQAISQEQGTAQTITGNDQPYTSAGATSIGQLMTGLQNGTFGAGGTPTLPTAPGAFVAPTIAQAQTDPGVQFAQQQGDLGILQGAAAGGGTISGGTLKSLAGYNNNLGEAAYNDVFSRDLQGFGANISGYQAQLQGVQTQLQAQQQAFNQTLAPATLGAGVTNNLNSSLSGISSNIANLLTGKGQAQAAGTVGAANSINNAIGSVANTGSSLVLQEAGLDPSVGSQLNNLGGLLNVNKTTGTRSGAVAGKTAG